MSNVGNEQANALNLIKAGQDWNVANQAWGVAMEVYANKWSSGYNNNHTPAYERQQEVKTLFEHANPSKSWNDVIAQIGRLEQLMV